MNKSPFTIFVSAVCAGEILLLLGWPSLFDLVTAYNSVCALAFLVSGLFCIVLNLDVLFITSGRLRKVSWTGFIAVAASIAGGAYLVMLGHRDLSPIPPAAIAIWIAVEYSRGRRI